MTDRATEIETVAPSVHRDLGADASVFAAEIRPHRSLGPRGAALVLGGFCLLSVIVSVPFVLLGAWPVVGFFGLDVFALWLAFRLSFAQARACEQVVLTYVELMIRKVTARGLAREWRFNPNWVRIEAERDDEFGMTQLVVTTRGKRLAVAEALSPAEREGFAAAFDQALAVARAGPRSPER